MFNSKLPPVFYINSKKYSASSELSYLLRDAVAHIKYEWKELVFLCIGSDRITGDSLGPLVGHLLSQYTWPHIHVYGTLKEPVHALNLEKTTAQIKTRHPLALIVAIDASLGSKKHIGFITLGMGALRPGLGVNKDLPHVGDIFITGITNVSGTFEHFLLQTTRLSTVIEMADSIAQGILNAIDSAYTERISGKTS
ncbi:MAG: spore protease YyaC [Ruminococcus sp.]|jgi:putative sporulation protein YyaC